MYRRFHKLRVRFAECELTQAEAARRAGIPPSTLTARMTGRLPFTARDIAGLCKVLDIPADQIGSFFLKSCPRARKLGDSLPRKYFPFYFTFRETAQTMPPRLRAVFYEAIIEYGTTGKEPTLPKSIAGYWPLVKPTLDSAKAHYDAGAKGGRPSKMILLVFLILKPTVYTKRRKKKKRKILIKERENSSARPHRLPPVRP